MRGTSMHTNHAFCRSFRSLCLALFLLVAACSNATATLSVTPAATRSAQTATITAYHGHASTIFAVAWSPDGTRIASGGNDDTIQIWNATSGHRLLTYTGHLGSVWTVAWSPKRTAVASGGNDGIVQVWDASSGHRLLTYIGHTAR